MDNSNIVYVKSAFGRWITSGEVPKDTDKTYLVTTRKRKLAIANYVNGEWRSDGKYVGAVAWYDSFLPEPFDVKEIYIEELYSAKRALKEAEKRRNEVLKNIDRLEALIKKEEEKETDE